MPTATGTRSCWCALLLAALVLVLLSGCISSASVKVENVSGTGHFWIPQGCYSTVYGIIKNDSAVDADDVTVSCTTTQQGEEFGRASKNIGSISAGSKVNFSVEADTDCMMGEVIYNCTAGCGNCAGAADGGGNMAMVVIAGVALVLAVAAVVFLSYKKAISGRSGREPKAAADAPKVVAQKPAKAVAPKTWAKTPAKCGKCGSKLEPGDKFCIKCGRGV